jgi:tetratricopeptide (TPR) repeat protein
MHRIFARTFLAITLSFSASGLAADKPDAPAGNAVPPSESQAPTQEQLRAYLQLQDQLHSALLAIEQARKEAEAAAQKHAQAIQETRDESDTASRRSAELIGARLRLIEQTLTNQHDRAVEAMQKSNRFMITLAAVFGGIGFLGMLFTAFCLWRALTRVAQITASLQPLHALHGRHTTSAVAGGDAPFVTLNGPETSSSRLLGAIEKLEKRIEDLEHTSLLPDSTEAARNASGLTAALANGQALLDSNEPEKALVCFDEALALEPGNAEALVKKGAALERLKRLEDAIECYDKAIAANQAMTVAYLHKGAVYNQLERFSEALECYEQALRTQQKPVNS